MKQGGLVTVKEINISEFPLLRRGKVRDIYDLGNELLIITTDRISAFDYVLPSLIPDKGRVLNSISVFWFNMFDYPNHLLHYKLEDFPEVLKKYIELKGRAVIVKKSEVFPVEAIVRGYLMGSGWKEYQKTGSLWGNKLPSGLKKGDKLPEPVFTPTTKADEGHDMPITFEEMKNLIGEENAVKIRDIALDVYKRGYEYALNRGIIIADTKLEFGLYDGEIIIIDEILTPDSSRFWRKEDYEREGLPDSMDKQIVRDYLETTGWDKNSSPPSLPDEIVQKVSETYKDIYTQLTGRLLYEEY